MCGWISVIQWAYACTHTSRDLSNLLLLILVHSGLLFIRLSPSLRLMLLPVRCPRATVSKISCEPRMNLSQRRSRRQNKSGSDSIRFTDVEQKSHALDQGCPHFLSM